MVFLIKKWKLPNFTSVLLMKAKVSSYLYLFMRSMQPLDFNWLQGVNYKRRK